MGECCRDLPFQIRVGHWSASGCLCSDYRSITRSHLDREIRLRRHDTDRRFSGGVILAVLPIFILRRARQLSEREPEYNVGVLYSPPVVKAALFIFYVGVLVYAAFAR